MKTQINTSRIDVLLVDDDFADCRLVKHILTASSGKVQFNVETAQTLREAVEYLSHGKYDILLLDLGLPDSNGIETVQKAHSANPNIPIVVLTGLTDEEVGIEAIRIGAEDYLVKGESLGYTLARTIRYAIERKQTKEKQTQLLKQVENINQELKQFAYIVSHDLKAPLRGIKTLVEWLVSDYADKLDENGKEQMNMLSVKASQMRNLINGILEYSKVGRVEEEKVDVNLNELVPEVIDMLAPPDSIAVTIENELPVVYCGQTRIMQVFQNLLSNSIKYMDKPQGQITVSCVEEDDFWKFSVADNGPGIDEKQFERIFQIFQTISSQDNSESTGIGLTVVKKIVELYGGKIWIESKPNEGSMFFFTLPKSKINVTGDTK